MVVALISVAVSHRYLPVFIGVFEQLVIVVEAEAGFRRVVPHQVGNFDETAARCVSQEPLEGKHQDIVAELAKDDPLPRHSVVHDPVEIVAF